MVLRDTADVKNTVVSSGLRPLPDVRGGLGEKHSTFDQRGGISLDESCSSFNAQRGSVNVNAMNRVDGLWRRLSFRLLPGCCVQCGAGTLRAADLCVACESDLPWNDRCCALCALPLTRNEQRCGRCQKVLPEFDLAHCALRYEWPLDALITRFKFVGDLAAGRVLSALMVAHLSSRWRASPAPRPQLLIPVPLHAQRLRERGFNQALELARPIAQALALSLIVDGLCRQRATPPQTGLNALHRRRNMRGAFAINTDVQGRDVALVDDVVTTAATVRECAKVLKRAGAASVQVWAVARAAAGNRVAS